MLTQAGIQLLVIGDSPRAAQELAHEALERGMHVWRPTPIGRSFAETIAAASLALRCGPTYRVASWFDGAAATISALVAFGPDAARPTYSELCIRAPGPAGESWRCSRTESGGGVLMNSAYNQLDALIALRGLPETVSAAIGALRHGRGPMQRDGEDTVAAILRYADGGLVNVRCAWDLTAERVCGFHHTPSGMLTLHSDRVAWCRSGGESSTETPLPSDALAADLAITLHAIRDPGGERGRVAIERHVAIVALVETIYLAARTQQPETPRKLYEVQGWPLPPQP